MQIGVQWTDTMSPHAVIDYYTWGWPPALDVVWMITPTTPAPGNPQVEWMVAVERSSANAVTYHITVTNISGNPVAIEGRYGILNA
jgi:hypothetical protein